MKFLITFKAEESDHSTLEYSGLFHMAVQYAKSHAKKIGPACTYTFKVEKEIDAATKWVPVDDEGNIEGGGQAE